MEVSKLDPKASFYQQKFQVFLTKREAISPDTYMFTFAFEDPKETLGLLITQHLLIYGENLNGEVVCRKYTATSPFEQEGTFEIPIKIYRPNVHPAFPQGGELTPWLEKIPIEVGTKVTIKRCIGKLIYQGLGTCLLKPKDNKEPQTYKRILMACGGTGITPIYQLIQAILKNPQDKTQLFLLYANRTEQDILLREILEQFAAQHPEQFKISYTLDLPPEGWTGFSGFVTLEMMQKAFPQPDHETLATLCGPKPMNKLVLRLYEELGVSEKNILKF